MSESAPINLSDRPSRRFAVFSFVTAGLTYALIVFGGIVRITGSGMGCGDDWPLCNGRLIPPLDFATLIEYGHRLAAALISFFVLGVLIYAVRHRAARRITGRGIVKLAVASATLLLIQVMVGAVTVWLELPTSTVVLHLALASALLATLVVGGLRVLPEAAALRPDPMTGYQRWALASAALGFLLLFAGGLVANTGAAPLCQGFPLCNGQIFPEGGGLVQLHWMHRLLAFALLIIVALAVHATVKAGAPAPVLRWAIASLALVIAQMGAAAALVLMHLPAGLRALHLAVGVALWAALIVWATLAVPALGLSASASRAASPAGVWRPETGEGTAAS